MQRALYRLLETTDTPAARAVDLALMIAIVASVAAMAVGTVPTLDPSLRAKLEILQLVAVVLFSVEYLFRLVAAGGKPEGRGSAREALGYATSFFGLVDLLAILPFYLEASGFVVLRSLRLLRLLRLFKLSRYSVALQTFAAVLRRRAPQLGVFMFLSGLLLFLSASGIYFVEHEAQPQEFSSIPASLWWAIVTLTTVGYGDASPATPMGKVFTSAILVIGIAVLAVPTGIISAGLVEATEKARSLKCPKCGATFDDDGER